MHRIEAGEIDQLDVDVAERLQDADQNERVDRLAIMLHEAYPDKDADWWAVTLVDNAQHAEGQASTLLELIDSYRDLMGLER